VTPSPLGRRAIGAVLVGAGWQRCRTHFANNLRAKTPWHAWPVAGMLRSVFEQPDAPAVHRQFREVCAALDGKFPEALAVLEEAETDVLAFTTFPAEHWRQIRSNNPQEPQNKERSAAAPASSASSPTAPRSSASSAPSSPNNTKNGPAPRRYMSVESLAKARVAVIHGGDPLDEEPEVREIASAQ
jgi:putative transposase